MLQLFVELKIKLNKVKVGAVEVMGAGDISCRK